MAVAHSAASESHTGTTGSTNQTSFSWTHTQTGTPQGVLVFVTTFNNTSSFITGVTYGSVTLQRVSGAIAQDTAGEPGRVDLFFSASSLPSGNATITVNRVNNATVLYAAAATVTAARPIECTGVVLVQGDGALAQVNVDDGSPGTNSLRYAAAYSGLASPPPAGANSTLLNSIDIGQYGSALCRETTAGQGSRPVGFTGGSDDRAAVHVVVRELPLVAGSSATNLLSSNEEFPTATWRDYVTSTTTLSKDTSQAGPFHGTAFRLTENTILSDKFRQTNSFNVASTGYYVFSIYAKSNGRDLRLRISHSASSVRTTYDFTLSGAGTGTVVTGLYETGELLGQIESVGNGWYRCSVAIDAATTDVKAELILLDAGATTYTGNGTSGLYIWGPQLEQAPVAGDYVRTPSTYYFINPEALFGIGKGLVAETGSFSLTGNAATLTKSGDQQLSLLAGSGAFALTGPPAATRHNPKIDGATGSFSLVAPAATTRHNARLEGGRGTFTLTGQPATTLHNPKIDGGVGAFGVTGQPATLTKASPKSLAADAGAFALASNGATLRRNYTLGAAVGAFATAGQPATLRHNPKIDGARGAFALTGGSPALLRGRYLSGGAGTFTETGQPATFRRTRAIQGGAGAFSLTGYPAALTEINAYQINALVGALSLTGNAAQLARSRRFSVVAGGFSFTGQAAGLRQAYALTADRGQFALTGGSPSLTWSRRSTFNTGSFSLTGNTAALLHATKLTGETGAFALIGLVAELAKQSARELAVNTGIFSLSGRPATLQRALLFGVSSGSFTLGSPSPVLQRGCVTTGGRGEFLLSGQPAELLKAYVLDASMGAFDLTGQSANLTDTDQLYPAAGAFNLSGQDAGLARSRTMPVTAGVFSLSGQATALLEGRGLTAERGTFSLSGQQNTLRQDYLLSGAAGSFSLTGNAAGLSKQTARELLGGVGAFSATGQAATLRQNPASAADRGQFTLSGQQATLKQGYLLTSAAGTFSLTGNPATLAKQSAKQLTAEAGALTLTGHAASLTVSGTVTRRRNVLIF